MHCPKTVVDMKGLEIAMATGDRIHLSWIENTRAFTLRTCQLQVDVQTSSNNLQLCKCVFWICQIDLEESRSEITALSFGTSSELLVPENSSEDQSFGICS